MFTFSCLLHFLSVFSFPPKSILLFFVSLIKKYFLSSLLFSIPPHAYTPFLFEVCGEKPHPAQSGVMFWIYTLAQLCFLSYLLSNTKCWFIIFSPATDLMFSRSVFQRSHEEGTFSLKMLGFVFLQFSVLLQEYVWRNSMASIHLILLPPPLWALRKYFVAYRLSKTESQKRSSPLLNLFFSVMYYSKSNLLLIASAFIFPAEPS